MTHTDVGACATAMTTAVVAHADLAGGIVAEPLTTTIQHDGDTLRVTHLYRVLGSDGRPTLREATWTVLCAAPRPAA